MLVFGSKKKLLLFIPLAFSLFYSINYYKSELTLNFYKDPTGDIYDLLIDLKGFQFVINPYVCQDIETDEFVIVTIHSSPTNYNKRRAIRSTWARWNECSKVVFFLGVPESNVVNLTNKIRIESDIYGDIVQGNFVDSYRNLTYKHVMVLKWVTHHCAKAKFIVKTDDDVLLDFDRLYHLLEEKRWGSRRVLACQIHCNSSVVRYYGSRNISLQEYPHEYYPRYCSGFIVIYSYDVIPKLLEKSRMIPYYFVDDVYVTGLLAKEIGLRHRFLNIPFLNKFRAKLIKSNQSTLNGTGPYIYGPYGQQWDDIRKLWLPLQRYNYRIEQLKKKESTNISKCDVAAVVPQITTSNVLGDAVSNNTTL